MRILIADDHELVRDTIVAFLKNDGFDYIISANCLPTASQAIATAVDKNFDVILLDYDMPGMNGLAGLTQIQELSPKSHVALISGSASPTIARQALQAGAKGFLPKTISATSLGVAIRLIASGQAFIPYDFLARENIGPIDNLTNRETEVLRGLCEGHSNKEMANNLSLAEVTIKLHVKTLCRKLGASNRTQAALIGMEKLR
ncbi:response regulator transcription factor [Paracoccus sp. JM45]|uniref:response regulator n=1 Tax=Paracoccus sp. JM45 TaxID=2283626 RepID=UPI000E6CB269|nr:response regulator transcription factor [Paracoccus sp. JM45]RJE79890.1 DNA-binding response regulator [Paracoccus sp. JM45]